MMGGLPMLPPFTPAVGRAVELARCYARSRSSATVLPVHLLMALLEEEEGRAFLLASAAGLSRQHFEEWCGSVKATSDDRDISLDERTQRLLRQARELAVELTGESTLSSEAVLLAVLRGDATALAELEARGLSLARLEARLQGERPPLPALDAPLCLVEPTEWVDTSRILDVSANRAREALRVVEDYCRFVLDDGVLSGELKQLRHQLAGALEDLSPGELLGSRETRRDVGTGISTESERHRTSPLAVVAANLKRLEEALRSLEEYGKITRPRLAEAVEQMRYRVYTIERALLLGSMARERLKHARLCVLLTGATCAAALDWTIAEVAAAGAGMIQLREKDLPDRQLLERARNVRRWTQKAGVLFIVNDRPDIARLVEADGVHLGQDDMPIKEARRIVGPDALIGVSTHTIEAVRQAVLDGASYIGVGPCFPSRTKSFDVLAGLEFVRQATRETTLPAFAIGGIGAETIGSVVEAGARRVAVSAAIAGADDPHSAAATLLAALP
jgi:thiamine-phosphate pyrophosphorylase